MLPRPIERQIEFRQTRRGEVDGLATQQHRFDELWAYLRHDDPWSITAHHECGHAIAYLTFGWRFTQITIYEADDGDILGSVTHPAGQYNCTQMACCCLGVRALGSNSFGDLLLKSLACRLNALFDKRLLLQIRNALDPSLSGLRAASRFAALTNNLSAMQRAFEKAGAAAPIRPRGGGCGVARQAATSNSLTDAPSQTGLEDNPSTTGHRVMNGRAKECRSARRACGPARPA